MPRTGCMTTSMRRVAVGYGSRCMPPSKPLSPQNDKVLVQHDLLSCINVDLRFLGARTVLAHNPCRPDRRLRCEGLINDAAIPLHPRYPNPVGMGLHIPWMVQGM